MLVWTKNCNSLGASSLSLSIGFITPIWGVNFHLSIEDSTAWYFWYKHSWYNSLKKTKRTKEIAQSSRPIRLSVKLDLNLWWILDKKNETTPWHHIVSPIVQISWFRLSQQLALTLFLYKSATCRLSRGRNSLIGITRCTTSRHASILNSILSH